MTTKEQLITVYKLMSGCIILPCFEYESEKTILKMIKGLK